MAEPSSQAERRVLAPERVLVGTTKEYGASVADARRAGEVPLAHPRGEGQHAG